jgi:phosphatidylserine/phosphatidylglycerophosphate/cardiolipin synthase-like enzyme
VSVDAALATVLERLSDAQVKAVVARCAGRTAPPSDLAQTVAGGLPAARDAVKALASAWSLAPGLTGAGVALALRAGLQARQDAAAHRSTPVWTGPCTTGEQRLTAGVLHDLITRAKRRVLVVSYAAYTLAEVAADLELAVEKGCTVDVVFETTIDSAGGYTGPQAPFSHVPGITRWRWPPDQRGPGAALHAKLLVIDGREALIGSANLTQRALTANLEAGVLIRDPNVAGALEAHIDDLIAGKVLVPAA